MAYNFKSVTIAAATALVLTSSCGNNNEEHKNPEQAAQPAPLPEVVLTPVGGSPDFPDAQLSVGSVKAVPQGKDSAKVSFEFGVKNYELKSQTSDAGNKQCNNSDKGQHIHFIMDNAPYVALYEPKHEVVLANNSEHYLMVFLSRSYHESVKTKGAAQVYHFRIDDKGKLQQLESPKTPMLFYSRPKGDYLGKDTANLLFDFYVWNAALGTDYKVKAVINNESNGQKKEAEITTWEPLFIQNLGTGKASVSISLVGKDGKAVEGPMTSATRNFQLAAQEPLK